MGFSTRLFAVGPERPRLALAHYDEGGLRSAAEAVSRLLPELVVRPIGVSNVGRGGYPPTEDQVWVSTFGPTVVFGGAEDGLSTQVAQAAGGEAGWWQLTIQSSSDFCQFEVREPAGLARELWISGEDSLEDADLMSFGDRLPFEIPYWAGEHRVLWEDEEPDEAALPFHPRDLGEAATAWIFGMAGEGAPGDEVQRSLGRIVGVSDVAMHGFQVIPAAVEKPARPAAVEKTAAEVGLEVRPKVRLKDRLGQLFGRSAGRTGRKDVGAGL